LNSPLPAEDSAEASARESAEPGGKRVSWAELYFDLIFVFAVSQTTHIMVASPSWGGFGRALGLFVPLWWTWIGFVVLCNRHYEDRVYQRLFVLAGTLPCAVAAVETHSAAAGQVTAFAFALAAARLVLALAFDFTAGRARQVAIGYGVSTAVFAASAFVPSPWRYVLWGLALIQEAGFLLLRNGELPCERGQGAAAGHRAAGSGAQCRRKQRRRKQCRRKQCRRKQRRPKQRLRKQCARKRCALISSAGVVLVTAVWAAVIAAWVTWRLPGRLQGVTADPLSYFRPARGGGSSPAG
jgi:hypothetical protein